MSGPPIGPENHTSRTCSRHLGLADDGSEILCGKPATEHVIYTWPSAAEYAHGFACADHWREYMDRWTCAGHHPVNGICGMPGSRLHPERECWFDGLDEAEPVREVAVAVAAGLSPDDATPDAPSVADPVLCAACGGSGDRNGNRRAADPFGTCPGCGGTGNVAAADREAPDRKEG